MIIKPKNSDYEHPEEEEYDDFEEVKEVEVREKAPKVPELSPEDPAYWDREEGEFEHLKPARSKRLWIWVGIAGVCVGLLYALYIKAFTSYSEGTIQYGYVESIERRGEIFKTFEGVLLPYKSLADTVTPYEGDIIFSAPDDHLAAELRRLMLANMPARVEFTRYRMSLPWRGESRVVITNVDTADVSKIYAPGKEKFIPKGR